MSSLGEKRIFGFQENSLISTLHNCLLYTVIKAHSCLDHVPVLFSSHFIHLEKMGRKNVFGVIFRVVCILGYFHCMLISVCLCIYFLRSPSSVLGFSSVTAP